MVIVAVVRHLYKPLVPLWLAGISSAIMGREQESILVPVAAVLLLHMLRLHLWLAGMTSETKIGNNTHAPTLDGTGICA